MQIERENKTILNQRDYNIAGNKIRAFYDNQDKLVFVIDNTVDDFKQNALLVITSVGNRKWDDILSNDYNVNLENIRPKYDNKYQKLDIEYDGLSVYDSLIQNHINNNDIDDDLKNLNQFRILSVRRATNERLNMANITAEKARKTIDTTTETISDLNDKIKDLREKLSLQRRAIGTEPTKQSAAKILRTEAQIEISNSKLKRAKKRLENAKKRLHIAEQDISDARKILSDIPENDPDWSISKSPIVPEIMNDDIKTETHTSDEDDDFDLDKYLTETEDLDVETDDNDNEIAPILTKDPKILDETIAFKPINFNSDIDHTESNEQSIQNNPNNDLSEPYASSAIDTDEDNEIIQDSEKETINDSVDVSESEQQENISKQPLSFTPPTVSPISLPQMPESDVWLDDNLKQEEPTVNRSNDAEQSNNFDYAQSKDIQNTPIPEKKTFYEPHTKEINAVSSLRRPSSPLALQSVTPTENNDTITNQNLDNTTNMQIETKRPNRAGKLYYLLLIMLIILSIFTLWLYKKSEIGNGVPNLLSETSTDNLFVQDAPEIKPEPVEITDPTTTQETIIEEPVPDQPTIPEEVVSPEPEPVEVIEPEHPTADIVDKPEYDVSDADVVPAGSGTAPNTITLCEDGSIPNSDGCCTGEILTTMDETEELACCPENGGDCFPPIINE